MKRLIFIFSFLFFASGFCFSQNNNSIVTTAIIIDGDTMPYIHLKEVIIFAPPQFKSRRSRIRYGKLVRNIKKVYPFAKLAGIKLSEYNEILVNVTEKKERRKIMRRAEDELQEEFGGDLKKLTFSQGKILLKLVDRETGECSYELVQELRGKFIAFFWQSFARIFGFNLKIRYDPKGKDKQIEHIVRMIEAGAI